MSQSEGPRVGMTVGMSVKLEWECQWGWDVLGKVAHLFRSQSRLMEHWQGAAILSHKIIEFWCWKGPWKSSYSVALKAWRESTGELDHHQDPRCSSRIAKAVGNFSGHCHLEINSSPGPSASSADYSLTHSTQLPSFLAARQHARPGGVVMNKKGQILCPFKTVSFFLLIYLFIYLVNKLMQSAVGEAEIHTIDFIFWKHIIW